MNIKLTNYNSNVDIIDNNIVLSIPAKELYKCSQSSINPSIYCWKLKLELHLRNSEVIGIPIINKDYKTKFKLVEYNFNNPLMGTHDNLYFKLINLDPINHDDPEKLIPIITIKFVSKTYWKLAKSKFIDGIISKPINIITDHD